MAGLQSVSEAIRRERAPEVIFYFCVNGLVFFGELNANTSWPVTLGTLWRHPYHSPFDGNGRGLIQQRQQQPYPSPQLMRLRG